MAWDTATQWKTLPVYKINAYLLDELIDAELVDPAEYNDEGEAAFIPVQQEPEVSAMPANIPFIVYNWLQHGVSRQDFFNQVGAASYVIYCDNHIRAVAIQNLMANWLRKQDLSAQAVNDHMGEGTPFIFHWIRLSASTAIEPRTEEGGRRGYLIAIQYEFTDERLFA